MKSINVYGKLTFPHFVKYKIGSMKKVVTSETYNPATRKKEMQYTDVIDKGTYNLIANPADPIVLGDQISHPNYKGVSYTITAILEERKAKGDWSFVDFAPILQVCEVQLNPAA